MKFGTAIAAFFVIWWVVLFAFLPFGVRTQGEAGEVMPGTPSSAPTRPRFLPKIVATTIVAGLVTVGLWALTHSGLGLDDIPFLPTYSTR